MRLRAALALVLAAGVVLAAVAGFALARCVEDLLTAAFAAGATSIGAAAVAYLGVHFATQPLSGCIDAMEAACGRVWEELPGEEEEDAQPWLEEVDRLQMVMVQTRDMMSGMRQFVPDALFCGSSRGMLSGEFGGEFYMDEDCEKDTVSDTDSDEGDKSTTNSIDSRSHSSPTSSRSWQSKEDSQNSVLGVVVASTSPRPTSPATKGMSASDCAASRRGSGSDPVVKEYLDLNVGGLLSSEGTPTKAGPGATSGAGSTLAPPPSSGGRRRSRGMYEHAADIHQSSSCLLNSSHSVRLGPADAGGGKKRGQKRPAPTLQSFLVKRRNVTQMVMAWREFDVWVRRAQDPAAVVELHSTWLQCSVADIRDYGGTVERFVGDEIHVDFGGLEAAVQPSRCAALYCLRLRTRLGGLPKDVAPCVGVASGQAFVGQIGIPSLRQMTVLGRSHYHSRAMLTISREMGLDIIVDQNFMEDVEGRFRNAPVDLCRMTDGGRMQIVGHLIEAIDTTAQFGMEWMYALEQTKENTACPYKQAWASLCRFPAEGITFAQVVEGFAQALPLVEATDPQLVTTARAVHARLKTYMDEYLQTTGRQPLHYQRLYRPKGATHIQVVQTKSHRVRSIASSSSLRSVHGVVSQPSTDTIGAASKLASPVLESQDSNDVPIPTLRHVMSNRRLRSLRRNVPPPTQQQQQVSRDDSRASSPLRSMSPDTKAYDVKQFEMRTAQP